MSLDIQQLPQELRDAVHAAIAHERAEKERFQAENLMLRDMIRLMNLRRFGPRSEQLSDRQMQLLAKEPSVTTEEVAQEAKLATTQPESRQPRTAKRDRKHPGRVDLPPHLERRIEVIPVPAEECQCPRCRHELPVIGFEESEHLDVEPARYFVRVVRREKRAAKCGCVEGVVCAPAPVRILPKSKFGDDLIVDFIDRKFGQHLPIYRQCDILARETGLELSRQTIGGVIGQVGGLLEAIRQSLRRDLLREGYIQADETPIGVQSPEDPGRHHTGRIWHYGRPGGPVVVDFQMSRGRDGPLAFLEGFRGTLQSDGYSAYDKLGPGIVYAGCLAHARRKFHEAHQLSPRDPVPLEVLERIGVIYAVEAEAREANATPAQRLALRQERSRMLMEDLKRRLTEIQSGVLPKSVMGRACAYALRQWPRLEVFLTDGRIEADNNWAENGLRPVVIGRKNFLHIGSEWAGPKLAAIWSVYGTCQRLGKSARAYLRSILPRLADWPSGKVDELSPLVWEG